MTKGEIFAFLECYPKAIWIACAVCLFFHTSNKHIEKVPAVTENSRYFHTNVQFLVSTFKGVCFSVSRAKSVSEAPRVEKEMTPVF